MAKKDEYAALKKKYPDAAGVVDAVVEILHSPHHIGGTAEHQQDEQDLERLAKELEGLIPRAAHEDFRELMDQARLSLTPPTG